MSKFRLVESSRERATDQTPQAGDGARPASTQLEAHILDETVAPLKLRLKPNCDVRTLQPFGIIWNWMSSSCQDIEVATVVMFRRKQTRGPTLFAKKTVVTDHSRTPMRFHAAESMWTVVLVPYCMCPFANPERTYRSIYLRPLDKNTGPAEV